MATNINEWEDLDTRAPIKKIDKTFYTPTIVADCRKIPRPDNTYSLVYVHSVLEHFSKWERMDCLREWYRVCNVGGKVWISVPDMRLLAYGLLNGAPEKRESVINFIYGEQDYPENAHKWGYIRSSLEHDLFSVGFKGIQFSGPKSYAYEIIAEAQK